MRNKLLVFLTLFMLVGIVAAQETYIETIKRLEDKLDKMEKDIRGDIGSFNQAFADTFKLVDDEISRLLYGNAAMVGIVFAIMFLVYAKTTSKTKRDMQILLAAHSKHLDNIISTRMDEFISRLETDVDHKASLASISNELTSIIDEELGNEEFKSKKKKSKKRKKKSKLVPQETMEKVEDVVQKVTHIEEAKPDVDGKVKLKKRRTSPLNRVKKRLRSGLFRLLGKKSKPKKEVAEFKV